jgi:hypothetical protein
MDLGVFNCEPYIYRILSICVPFKKYKKYKKYKYYIYYILYNITLFLKILILEFIVMEALMIWSLIHSQLLIFRNGEFVVPAKGSSTLCVWQAIFYPLLALSLGSYWEHCWELENMLGTQ